MELTKKDRLFLINQYEILRHLDSAQEDWYTQAIEICENGYSIFYSDLDRMTTDEMSYDEGRFVLDILSIYGEIEHYKRHHPDDVEICDHVYGIYRGFDGNDEVGYFAFSKFLIEKQGKFSEQLPYGDMIGIDHWNSHGPMVDPYSRMIAEWLALKKNLRTRENIIRVLNAGRLYSDTTS